MTSLRPPGSSPHGALGVAAASMLLLSMLSGCAGLGAGGMNTHSGATTATPGSSGATATAAAAAGVWQYPASDFPAMCIVMQADGSLRFVGGFLFFDPGNWRVDPSSGLTALTLGGSGPFPGRSGPASAAAGAARQAGRPAPAVVLHSDPSKRRLDYRIDAGTPAIEFAGFVFFRSPSCSAAS